jgi:hypothetical protein
VFDVSSEKLFSYMVSS